MISFTVPGPIRGKGRPRFVRATGRTYTPAETVSYENLLKTVCMGVMGSRPPSDRAISLEVAILLAPAASASKKRRQDMLDQRIWPLGKPDIDNVLKLVMDALNGIAWVDDKQIITASISRRYGPEIKLVVHISEYPA